jgi:hypothetical protein
MKLEAKITGVIKDGMDLSITIRGWYDIDPVGTLERPLGTINIPSTERTRRAYHIGRRLFINVRPS